MATYHVEVKWKTPSSGSSTSSRIVTVDASSPSEAERKAKEQIQFEKGDVTSIMANVRNY